MAKGNPLPRGMFSIGGTDAADTQLSCTCGNTGVFKNVTGFGTPNAIGECGECGASCSASRTS